MVFAILATVLVPVVVLGTIFVTAKQIDMMTKRGKNERMTMAGMHERTRLEKLHGRPKRKSQDEQETEQ